MKRKIKKFTETEVEEFRQKRLSSRANLTIAFQLGFYVGEEIVNKYLPTLSVDMFQTRKVISVTIEEYNECKRLDEVWFEKSMSFERDDNKKSEATKEEWQALRAYHEILEEKYLPKTIDCHFGLLNITENDMEEFKKGVSLSLWDCDCSHYSVKEEDISVVPDEDGYFTVITLKRD